MRSRDWFSKMATWSSRLGCPIMEENVSRCWLTAHWLWGEEKKCTWEKKSSVSRGRGAEGVAAGAYVSPLF